jgi:DNA-binding transcriptional LysR family regulator
VRCLGEFAKERPDTRIELHETVLGGTDEALAARSVDFAICSSVPQGFVGDLLMPVRAVCVAAPSHPLHALGRPLTLEDLRRHRHLVIRDSGAQRARSVGWLNEQRWTVSHKATSIHAVVEGHGYSWFPEEWIVGELARGALLPLPLREGAQKEGSLFLVFADRDTAGPGTRKLAQIIRDEVASGCRTEVARAAKTQSPA